MLRIVQRDGELDAGRIRQAGNERGGPGGGEGTGMPGSEDGDPVPYLADPAVPRLPFCARSGALRRQPRGCGDFRRIALAFRRGDLPEGLAARGAAAPVGAYFFFSLPVWARATAD